jgi:hypothetical protein
MLDSRVVCLGTRLWCDILPYIGQPPLRQECQMAYSRIFLLASGSNLRFVVIVNKWLSQSSTETLRHMGLTMPTILMLILIL